MRELVGYCTRCGKEVFCVGGNLEGVVLEGEIYCLECSATEEDRQKIGEKNNRSSKSEAFPYTERSRNLPLKG